MTPALRKAAPWSAGLPALLIHVVPVFRKSALPGILLAGSALAGCATHTPPPEISYDNAVPAVQTSDPPAPVRVVELPKPLPLPGQLKPIGKDGKPLAGAAKTSFVTKCEKDAGAACDKQAADKKLSGAAKTSFTTKCVKDAVGT